MTYLQSLIDGVGLGAVYAVVAVGIGLVFGVMRLVNLAYGELITAGGYTLAFTSGSPALVAIAACIAVVRRPRARPGAHRVPAAARRLAGDDADRDLRGQLPASERLPARVRLAREHGRRRSAASTRRSRSARCEIRWITIVAVDRRRASCSSGSTLLLNRTTIGLELRAAAADFRTARMLGVRANRVIAFAFALSGLLAASVAVLLTVQSPLVTPDYGVSVTIFALVGVVVGGLDRLWTATLGGFAIGFATAFVGDQLPSSSSEYLPSVVYGLVIVVLLVRPSGLFAGSRATAAERV